MTFKHHGHGLASARGLVPTVNGEGVRYGREEIQRWIRINRVVFKAEKIDLLVSEATFGDVEHYIQYAQDLDAVVSIRTQCEFSPPDLESLKDAGLHDLMLTPAKLSEQTLDSWLAAARDADIRVRLQLPLPYHQALDAKEYAERYAQRGVAVVNLSAYDPFVGDCSTDSKQQTETTLAKMGELVDALEARNVEANILHVPFCAVDTELWKNVANEPQCFRDHQHYIREAWELATLLYSKGPIIAKKVLLMTLGKYTLIDDPIDNKLLPWLIERPWLRARVVAWHRLTRHLRLTRAVPKAIPIDSDADASRALEKKTTDTLKKLGATCGLCSLRGICNYASHSGAHALKGFRPESVDGDMVMSPMHFASKQHKYYDDIDEDRCNLPSTLIALTAEANDILKNIPPDREIDSFDYQIDGQWCHQLPGGVRWYGFTNSEKVSSVLATLDPPFTVSYIAGGGIAEYAGFSLGREAKLLCYMEAYQHTLTLHVNKRGEYVLLRDGKPVQPVQFEGRYYAPMRFGTQLQPRISIWNIDQSLVTQNLKLWNESLTKAPEERHYRFTVITMCVRYARRLQAMLQAIAHQQGIELSDIEVIVAYLPDADPTEDILESMSLAHPELTIRRTTFSEDKRQAKGFIINECLEKARGEWVMLLDADTIIPPNMFVEIDKHTDGANFIVPDGRKLLSPEVTSEVLLGNRRPWEEWDALLDTDGEFRYREMDGTPIGFCQIVRRSCFEKVKYYEVDHFEGADWQFSIHMREEFGDELRLSGVPVLHLDHGGSKWYGTARHF
ncbi:MAG TPA: glycosyltransferase family 2 protein [Candidatus Hydrogenedentes bacterium]|nr:glycosyltransferase family 2 protein [Candidatus Hydrogenedentota bacterium]